LDPAELTLIITQLGPDSPLRVGQRLITDRAATLGRAPDADLRLDDRTVSRLHARLWPERAAWWIQRLAPHNGLFLDGQELSPDAPARLPDMAQLQVGGVLLALHVALATAPVTAPLVAPPAPFLRLVRDGDRCAFSCKGRFVPLKPTSALALYALARRAGQVLHTWDMQQLMGVECNLPQALSGVRRALRELLEEGWVSPQELRAWIARASGGQHLRRLEEMDDATLIRHFVMTRRGHGAILMAPPEAVLTEEEG
jgi:hypothetical protein